MSFLGSLNIAGSALTAERFRMEVIMQNISNISTTETEGGGPYRRKQVVFQERGLEFKNVLNDQQTQVSQGGVRVKEVVESQTDFIPVYDPSSPSADENGYVMMPNVSSTEEQADMMAASRAYEANLTALNVVKAMAMKALEIGK